MLGDAPPSTEAKKWPSIERGPAAPGWKSVRTGLCSGSSSVPETALGMGVCDEMQADGVAVHDNRVGMVDSRTDSLRVAPGVIREHVLPPERERRALCRFRFVDGTALRLIEVDAGAGLSARLEYPAAIRHPPCVSRQPLCARELVMFRQAVCVLLGEVDYSFRFVAAAPAVGQAGELDAFRPPIVVAVPKHPLPAPHRVHRMWAALPHTSAVRVVRGPGDGHDEAETASHLYALHSCPETSQEVWAK